MKNILKFIYNLEDKGVYRIRTILGIKITTKPLILRLISLENKIDTLIFKNNDEFMIEKTVINYIPKQSKIFKINIINI